MEVTVAASIEAQSVLSRAFVINTVDARYVVGSRDLRRHTSVVLAGERPVG